MIEENYLFFWWKSEFWFEVKDSFLKDLVTPQHKVLLTFFKGMWVHLLWWIVYKHSIYMNLYCARGHFCNSLGLLMCPMCCYIFISVLESSWATSGIQLAPNSKCMHWMRCRRSSTGADDPNNTINTTAMPMFVLPPIGELVRCLLLLFF